MGTQPDFVMVPEIGTLLGMLLALLPWLFGGGALLMVGGRYIAKSPKATYWRSVGAITLAGLASGIILTLASGLSFRLLGPLGFVGVLAGAAAGLLVTWLIIVAMFAVSFGKAILAWLPTLAMAIVALPIIAMPTAMLAPYIQQAHELTKRDACMSNLSLIGKYAMLYRGENDDKWPADLQLLATAGNVQPKVFVCPCVRYDSRPTGRTYDYFYFPPKSDDDPRAIVACDFGGNHGDGSRHVLSVDGSVHKMPSGAFQAALADPANAAFAAALWQAEASAGTPPRGD